MQVFVENGVRLGMGFAEGPCPLGGPTRVVVPGLSAPLGRGNLVEQTSSSS
jgi:hypothetical protein